MWAIIKNKIILIFLKLSIINAEYIKNRKKYNLIANNYLILELFLTYK